MYGGREEPRDENFEGPTQATGRRKEARGQDTAPVPPAHIARRRSRIYGDRGSVIRWVGSVAQGIGIHTRPRKPPLGMWERRTPLPRFALRDHASLRVHFPLCAEGVGSARGREGGRVMPRRGGARSPHREHDHHLTRDPEVTTKIPRQRAVRSRRER